MVKNRRGKGVSNWWVNSATRLIKMWAETVTDNVLTKGFHTEQKKKVWEWMSNALKETEIDLQKHASRGKRVRETNREKMTGLNRPSCNTIRQCQAPMEPKTERAMTPWVVFFAIYLTPKNVLGISAGMPKQGFSLILRQTCVIKKVEDIAWSTALSKMNHHFDNSGKYWKSTLAILTLLF